MSNYLHTFELIGLEERPDYLPAAIDYFWRHWGSDSNYHFYRDCIEHAISSHKELPKFYLLLDGHEIIGSYALLVNDIISRQDLMPWFACLYVEESYRGRGLAGQLLEHGLSEAARKGFDRLYLSTDLVNFYERKGWTLLTRAYNIVDQPINVYEKATSRS
jgi:GNAT superfamily N-acetyltransferase